MPTFPCRRPASTRRTHGYLLIELVIALGIIVVGVFAMLSVQRSQVDTGRELARYDVAIEAASSVLERVRAGALPIKDVSGEVVGLDLPSEKTLPECECRLWASDYRPDTPGLKQVRVVVSWRARTRRPRTVGLETLVFVGAKDAPQDAPQDAR